MPIPCGDWRCRYVDNIDGIEHSLIQFARCFYIAAADAFFKKAFCAAWDLSTQ